MPANFMGQNVGFATPDADRQLEIQRRLAMAQALQQQGMEPIQEQKVPGGWAVPIHPLQGAAKLAQTYVGTKAGGRAQELAKQLQGDQQARRGADIGMLVQALQGRPAQPAGLAEDAAGNVTPTDPLAAQTPSEGLQQALPRMQDPAMQQAALQAFMAQQPKRPEPFTLAPGAVRYGPDGKPVATAPVPTKAPEPFTLAPGAIRYGADGKPIAESPKEQKPLVTVDMRGENKYAETVGTKSGERDITQHDTALAAVENISKLDLTLKQITESQAITGMGAEILKDIERAKQLVMRDQASGKKVSDTELLDALLGSDVFPMIKALGIGARGLDTPAEREFLRNVMTGTVQLNRETLRRMTEIRRDISKRAVERWNDRVGSGELDRYFRASGMPKQKLKLPKVAGGPPKEVDPALWNAMTPEDKALWQTD